jgi:hypothetical protein
VEGREVSEVMSGGLLSPSGRFWIGDLLLLGPLGLDPGSLVLADFGLAEPIRACTPNPASLAFAEGLVLAGRTGTFRLEGGPAPGARSLLYFALGSAVDAAGCGLPFPFGEVLLDRSAGFFLQNGPSYAGAPVDIPLSIPLDLALVDLELFAQGVFFDPLAVPGQRVTLTDALRLEIGAP